MSMILIVLLTYYTGITFGQIVNNVDTLRTGQPYDGIVSPGYPNSGMPSDTTVEWNFTVEPQATIKVLCNDIRMGQRTPWTEDCEQIQLSFDDGYGITKVCGRNKSGYMYVSKGPKLVVKLMAKEGSGQVQCTAYSESKPTGPNANQYQNVFDEDEDSSEFGVTPGKKSTTCDCGRANKSPARITNGQEASENEFPWMVYLKIYFPFKKGFLVSYCGASIITRRHVLTAAHCVIQQQTGAIAEPGYVRMFLAEHNKKITSGNEMEMDGEKLYIHENFIKYRTHDIAVIFTKDSIEFGPLIGPVCLSPVQLPILNRRVQILGWGQMENRKSTDVLRKSKATVIDRLLCRMAEWEICTQARPSATCTGDSGSPQVWVDPETNRYTQISLASKAFHDCYSGPNTQTDVQYFFSWIEDVINKSDPSQMICQKVN